MWNGQGPKHLSPAAFQGVVVGWTQDMSVRGDVEPVTTAALHRTALPISRPLLRFLSSGDAWSLLTCQKFPHMKDTHSLSQMQPFYAEITVLCLNLGKGFYWGFIILPNISFLYNFWLSHNLGRFFPAPDV